MPSLNQDGTLRWVQKEKEGLEYAAAICRMVGHLDPRVMEAGEVCQAVSEDKLTKQGLQLEKPATLFETRKGAKDGGAKAG